MVRLDVTSLFVALSMVLCLVPGNSIATEVSQPDEVSGEATLTLQNIGQSQTIFATWELDIQIPNMIGVDFLPDKDMGLRYQVDAHLGDGDGFISSFESTQFHSSLEQNRTWTNGELGGCCSFDLAPFFSTSQIQFTPFEIGIGPVLVDHPWGWSERANLTGSSDSRQVRLLDIPRTGSIVEEVPLKIILPSSWEYRFSAQSAVISPNEDGFTIDRSIVAAFSDIRVALGINEPPLASAVRQGGGSSTAPSGSELRFTGTCTDSGLTEPIPVWSISGSLEIESLAGAEINLPLGDYDLSHGDRIHMSMTCTDRHNSSSAWAQTFTIDDEPPNLSISLHLSSGTGIWNDVELDGFDFPSPSGSVVRAMVSAIDENGDPVSITISSNRSGGFVRTGFDSMEVTEAFYHGDSANGQHREPGDRMAERSPTTYYLAVTAQDSSGNRNESNFTITVVDDQGPVIVPVIIHEGVELGVGSNLKSGETIVLVLNQSYDRLDALNETVWTIMVDGTVQVDSTLYQTFNGNLNIGPMVTGEHTISIQATDPAGHTSLMDLPLSVYPGEGIIFIEDPNIEVSGQTTPNQRLTVSSSILNHGSGTGTAKLCSDDKCSPEAYLPPASLLGPGQTMIFLEVTPEKSGELPLVLIWSDAQSGKEMSIDLTGTIVIEDRAPTWLPPFLMVLFIVSTSSIAIKRWGKQGPS